MRSTVEEGAARAMKAGKSQIPKVLAAGELLPGPGVREAGQLH